MARVTAAQSDVIKRAKNRSNIVNFKVRENTMVSMIRAGLIELHIQRSPYFIEYYKLTEKAINT